MTRDHVFISYRRDDTAGYARAVYDALAGRFGAARVFIDVDDIAAGQPFRDVIERAVGRSGVLLALIGRRWRGEHADGAARIGEEGDLVRREVAAALERGVLVIPVLLDGAVMPGEAQLPAELRALAGRNAIALDNAEFGADMERLLAVVAAGLGAPPLGPRRRRLFAAGIAAGALVTVAALAALWRRATRGDETPASPVATRPQVNGRWQAEVSYDWPNARYIEAFVFAGDGDGLHGSASFLGVPRGILEAQIEPAGLRFVTRTGEIAGGATLQVVHRYRGRLQGDEIHFVMQTEGGGSAHVPVEFVARRLPPAASPAAR